MRAISGVIGRGLVAGGLAAAALAMGVAPAQARVFVGLGFGVPLYYPPPPIFYPAPPVFYAPPPVVYAPPPVVYAPPPPVVVQQAPAPGPAQSWYYCDNPKGYYPYVDNCPAGWRAVPATPPAAAR